MWWVPMCDKVLPQIQTLIRAGANVRHVNELGETALSMAERAGAAASPFDRLLAPPLSEMYAKAEKVEEGPERELAVLFGRGRDIFQAGQAPALKIMGPDGEEKHGAGTEEDRCYLQAVCLACGGAPADCTCEKGRLAAGEAEAGGA